MQAVSKMAVVRYWTMIPKTNHLTAKDDAHLSAVLMVVVAAVLCGTLPAHAAGKKQVWRIEQENESEGPVTILVSDDCVKFSVPDQNIVCLASAPKWKVVSYNPKEKLINELPLERWVHNGFRLFGKRHLDFAKLKSRARSVWQGHPVEEITTAVTQSDPLKEKLEMFYQESKGRSLEFNAEQFVYEKFIPLSPAQRDFLSAFYGTPGGNGLLLQRTRLYPGGRRDVALKTISCMKVSVNALQLSYPKNLKAVPEVSDVTMEKRKLEQAGHMFEEMFGK